VSVVADPKLLIHQIADASNGAEALAAILIAFEAVCAQERSICADIILRRILWHEGTAQNDDATGRHDLSSTRRQQAQELRWAEAQIRGRGKLT
jgi:hypothetical protein